MPNTNPPTINATIPLNTIIIKVISAIATSDVKKLCTVKGLGKKTAERIILELGEKLVTDSVIGAEKTLPVSAKANQDAVDALMSLGFKKTESENAVIKAQENGLTGLEEIIAYAIRNVK